MYFKEKSRLFEAVRLSIWPGHSNLSAFKNLKSIVMCVTFSPLLLYPLSCSWSFSASCPRRQASQLVLGGSNPRPLDLGKESSLYASHPKHDSHWPLEVIEELEVVVIALFPDSKQDPLCVNIHLRNRPSALPACSCHRAQLDICGADIGDIIAEVLKREILLSHLKPQNAFGRLNQLSHLIL